MLASLFVETEHPTCMYIPTLEMKKKKMLQNIPTFQHKIFEISRQKFFSNSMKLYNIFVNKLDKCFRKFGKFEYSRLEKNVEFGDLVKRFPAVLWLLNLDSIRPDRDRSIFGTTNGNRIHYILSLIVMFMCRASFNFAVLFN